jgi:hypothetical protein
MISKKFKGLSKREVYCRLFEILNYAQNDKETKLTTSEIRILTEFILLPKVNNEVIYRFSIGNKKRVLDNYNAYYGQILNNRNLNSILTNLRKKGLVYKDADGMNYLSPFIENKMMNKDSFKIEMVFEDFENDGE